MAEVSVSAILPAPTDKVWAVLTDFDRFGEWNTIHTAFPGGGPAELVVGAVYSEKMTLMGMPSEAAWTVTELEQGRSWKLAGKGPMGIELHQHYRLEPAGESTSLTVASEFKGAAVSVMAARIKDATTLALTDSLQRLAVLVG